MTALDALMGQTADPSHFPDVIVDMQNIWHLRQQEGMYCTVLDRDKHPASAIDPAELWFYSGEPKLDADCDILIFFGINRAEKVESRREILLNESFHTPKARYVLDRRGMKPECRERWAEPDWMLDVDGVLWERIEPDRYADPDGNIEWDHTIDARVFAYRSGNHDDRIGWRGMRVLTGVRRRDEIRETLG